MMMIMMSSGSVGCSFSQSGDICESKWFFCDDTLWFWIGDLLLAAVCDVMVSSA
jgi:hypothetical protein